MMYIKPHNMNKECMKHLAVWSAILIFCATVWVTFLLLVTPATAHAQSGPPQGEVLDMLYFPGTRTSTNVTYFDENTQSIVSEEFLAPDIFYINNRPVKQISQAQFAAQGETFQDLPTFALAKWHWWLIGFVLLPEAQRQYADCVGQIKAFQKLHGLSPLIDAPPFPLAIIVESIRQYTVPFDNFQSQFGAFFDPLRPPTKQEAIVDAEAALMSYNVTVHHVGLCHSTLAAIGLSAQ
jgi:hypothetical protein